MIWLGAGHEACRRHRHGDGHAARLRRRGDVAAPARGRERRQQDRHVRRLRHLLQDRLRDPARRRHRRHLQSRSVDGAEGAAQGRRVHRLSPCARRRQALDDAGWKPTSYEEQTTHRRADRLRHRRRRRHRRDRDHPAREGPAPGVAVLHSRPHHQSRLRLCLDRVRPQGPEPRGGHRLLDRRACDRRCRRA